MSRWAFMQVLLSAVGVGLIFFTFVQTRRAADSAAAMVAEGKLAAIAATDTALAMRIQLRPHVSLDFAGIAAGKMAAERSLNVRIKNTGQTAARGLIVRIGKAQPNADDPLVGTFIDAPKEIRLGELPATQVATPGLHLSPEEVVAAIREGRTLYWRLTINYTDVFGEHHGTEFLLSSEAQQLSRGLVGVVTNT